jgi:ABC-type spermidine/putrescine transport system permease subunit II
MVVYTMVKKNIEPSINAISTIVLIATTILIFVADRAGREESLTAKKAPAE